MKKFLCIGLVLMMLVSLAACGQQHKPAEPTVYADGAVITIREGEPTKTFTVEVVDKDGAMITVTVKTDLETVGEVLQEAGMLQGEQGDYGLYIKTVNGTYADYDTDGTYWAFYVNGEYAAAGVDMTESVDGDVYRFVVETM